MKNQKPVLLQVRSSPSEILEHPPRFGMCDSAEKLICSGYAMEINFSALSHIRKTLQLF